MILASRDMKRKRWPFHVGAFLSTAIAWSCRFLLLNFLIIGFVKSVDLSLWAQGALFARLETMFVIIAFSPTPGGAGFVEILFSGFLSDYVNLKTNALIIASIWRILTYYSYLLAGAIIIPNWVRKILISRRHKRGKNKKSKATS